MINAKKWQSAFYARKEGWGGVVWGGGFRSGVRLIIMLIQQACDSWKRVNKNQFHAWQRKRATLRNPMQAIPAAPRVLTSFPKVRTCFARSSQGRNLLLAMRTSMFNILRQKMVFVKCSPREQRTSWSWKVRFVHWECGRFIFVNLGTHVCTGAFFGKSSHGLSILSSIKPTFSHYCFCFYWYFHQSSLSNSPIFKFCVWITFLNDILGALRYATVDCFISCLRPHPTPFENLDELTFFFSFRFQTLDVIL